MKRIWRVTISGLAFLLIGLLAWPLQPIPVSAQAEEPPDGATRTVTVSGRGEVQAQPDVAVVTLGVETQAETASAALNQNSEQMQALIDALQAAGIAEENIQTETVRLNPQYADQPEPQAGQPDVTGYVAVNTVQVRIENLDNVGQILDAAVEAGGNRIQGIRFEVSNPTELLQQAREQAWQDALQKAQQLANLAEAELGPALDINATDQGPSPVVQETFAEADAARVPIQPGTQTISADLQVTWRLQ